MFDCCPAYRAIGLSGYRAIGLSGYRAIGLSGYRVSGLNSYDECECFGKLEALFEPQKRGLAAVLSFLTAASASGSKKIAV